MKFAVRALPLALGCLVVSTTGVARAASIDSSDIAGIVEDRVDCPDSESGFSKFERSVGKQEKKAISNIKKLGLDTESLNEFVADLHDELSEYIADCEDQGSGEDDPEEP